MPTMRYLAVKWSHSPNRVKGPAVVLATSTTTLGPRTHIRSHTNCSARHPRPAAAAAIRPERLKRRLSFRAPAQLVRRRKRSMTASRPQLLRLHAQLEPSHALRLLRRRRESPGGRPTRAAGNQRPRTAGSQQCAASSRAPAAGNRGGATCRCYMDAAAVSPVLTLTRNASCTCMWRQTLHEGPPRARSPQCTFSRLQQGAPRCLALCCGRPHEDGNPRLLSSASKHPLLMGC